MQNCDADHQHILPFTEFIHAASVTIDAQQVRSAFTDYESTARSKVQAQIADYADRLWQRFDKRMSTEIKARDSLIRQLTIHDQSTTMRALSRPTAASNQTMAAERRDTIERREQSSGAAGGTAVHHQESKTNHTHVTGLTSNLTGRDSHYGSPSAWEEARSVELPKPHHRECGIMNDEKDKDGASLTSQDNDNRRWSDATQLTGTDSAVPPSPFSLMSRPSPHQLDDLDESVLFDDGTVTSTPRYRQQNGTGDEADDSDDSGNFEERDRFENQAPQRQRTRHSARARLRQANSADVQPIVDAQNLGAGKLALGTSLPVTIPAKYWPPKDAYASPREFDSDDVDEFGYEKQPANVCLPHRRAKNPHERIVELSRSIQPADDPERLFGERPNRRRYATGEQVLGAPGRHVPDMPTDLC